MIIYHNTKGKFLDDSITNNIEDVISRTYYSKTGSKVSENEIRSWKNSLLHMYKLLSDPEIPDDCHVSIEYRIPQTSKRIDFILTGQDDQKTDYALIIELKQWETAEKTDKDAVVITYLGKSKRELSHPSYQAWSYAALLSGFNEAIYSENIRVQPCAYLHNYTRDGELDHPCYQDYIDKAPVFFRSDTLLLRNFIKRYIKYGDKSNIMYRIESGRIKPSKSLADSLSSMLKGNREFVLIDDQKIIFETAKALALRSNSEKKKVFIVEGGPGTGKTVVAINLLVSLTQKGLVTQYVTKNAAPRAVYQSKLTGTLKKTHITNLFKGSGSYYDSAKNSFDALIVDETHRLNEKSGLFNNLGENQIKEIIHASKFSVFFIDEDQRVTLNDIGTKDEIRKWAYRYDAEVYESELSSQFRCNGSDGYLAWLDSVLQIRQTANDVLDTNEYDFNVFRSPTEMRDAIFEKNKINNKARLVAGYCWDWKSKKDPKAYDIIISEFDFRMRWNLASYAGLWSIDPNSVTEVGCIHTCQGLELDYVGVIIGPDLIIRNGNIITDVTKRSGMDKSVFGYKRTLKSNYEEGAKQLDKIIKNTYRTLMTRGLKGCYIYCTDKETADYFSEKIARQNYFEGDELNSLVAEK